MSGTYNFYGPTVLLNVVERQKYSVILSVLDPRKCEYLKDYSLNFEHAYTTTYMRSMSILVCCSLAF